MKITRKLFFTFLGVTTCVLLANLALARWSFQQGFLDFINALEQERLSLLSRELKREYIWNNNSWDNLDFQLLNEYLALRAHPGRGQGKRPLHPPPEAVSFEPGDRPSEPPTALYDASGQWLMGSDPAELGASSVQLPIYLEGEKIGLLRSWPEAPGALLSASQFSRKQLMASLIIGLLSLVFAGIISWFVARRLLKPVRSVLCAVDDLSKGNYDTDLVNHRSDELGELMANISELGDILQKNRTANQRWFANISHELRTPLTILKGEIESLQAGIRPFNQQQLESFAHEIDLLHHLVDDLYQLSLTDIGALRYRFEYLNISEIIQAMVPSLSDRARQHGLTFECLCEDNIRADIDKVRFEQLLINLTTNSFLYTEAPGIVKLSVQLRAQQVFILLEDSPPGADLDDFEQLFAPLHRQDYSRQRHSAGAGLGLSICRSIVDAHKGEISAAASKLGGLKVSVRFNLRRTDPHEH